MILYYALGGGLGHLTRGRRVLEALGLTHDAAFLTASPYARDPRVTGGIPVIPVPPHLEHTPTAHHRWLRDVVRRADRLLVDTFPAGIQGELHGLDVEMDFVARILRWDEYRRAVPGQLPTFERIWLAEQLSPEQEPFVRQHGRHVAPLDLPVTAGEADPDDHWLIVHSGPADEVRELVAYTAELRALATTKPSRILVASPCSIPLPQGFAPIDAYPATHLFPSAAKIITAAGYNVMLETTPWRHKHEIVPFARRFDDQYLRASRRKAKC
ncbi:MAG: hypothetical protein QOH21_2237 [Acidobacteriota bacterium]|jgi:hypothetical protein|nr:hypothetical protein [Acidobacteriota bacterium]